MAAIVLLLLVSLCMSLDKEPYIPGNNLLLGGRYKEEETDQNQEEGNNRPQTWD
ncbi:Hypothetical predicted protein [Pelobates cultripes]|uniref:Uncharacterized protein n=1 Tax=Pelobates cultripes TaxID=61616 RepID=A0AAD1VXC8_PELCU|nr:Hypothetical predicted protein [Pelobates cultripes]